MRASTRARLVGSGSSSSSFVDFSCGEAQVGAGLPHWSLKRLVRAMKLLRKCFSSSLVKTVMFTGAEKLTTVTTRVGWLVSSA